MSKMSKAKLAYHQQWRDKNREKLRAQRRALRAADPHYMTNYYHAHWNKWLLSSAKKRAKKLGLDFNIDESDISVPTHCPLLEIKLQRGVGKVLPCSPSLDRIDSSKGYVKGNVWVISHRANSMKCDATLEEHTTFFRNITRLLTAKRESERSGS